MREDPAALAARSFAATAPPRTPRTATSTARSRVLGTGLRHLGHRLGRAGLDHVERLALGGGDPFPADHQQLRHAPLLRDVTER